MKIWYPSNYYLVVSFTTFLHHWQINIHHRLRNKLISQFTESTQEARSGRYENSTGERGTSSSGCTVNRIRRWTFTVCSGRSEDVRLFNGRDQDRFVNSQEKTDYFFCEFVNYKGLLISLFLFIGSICQLTFSSFRPFTFWSVYFLFRQLIWASGITN